MELIAPTLIAIVSISWIVFEMKPWAWLRISLGLATMVGVAYVTYVLTTVTPKFESAVHRASMIELEKVLQEPDRERAVHAVKIYNEIARSGGNTYSAATGMWKVLHEKNGASESRPAEQVAEPDL